MFLLGLSCYWHGMKVPLRSSLIEDLASRKLRNPQFSMRAYARYLGINPTSLSLYLRGKRDLDGTSIERIRGRLSTQTGLAFEVNQAASSDYVELESDNLRVMSDWYFFAILSLMETNDYVDDHRWIAGRLGLSLPIAQRALETLEKCGAVVFKRGRRVPAQLRFRTTDGIRDLAVQRSHLQALDLARRALEDEPVARRHFSAITLAIDPKLLPEAARRITRFRRSLAKYLEKGNQTEVYRMSVQLFPLSNQSPKGGLPC